MSPFGNQVLTMQWSGGLARLFGVRDQVDQGVDPQRREHAFHRAVDLEPFTFLRKRTLR